MKSDFNCLEIKKNSIWKRKYVNQRHFYEIFKNINKKVNSMQTNQRQPNAEFELARSQAKLRELETEFYTLLKAEFQRLVKNILTVFYNRVTVNFIKFQINFDFLKVNKLNFDSESLLESRMKLKLSLEAYHSFILSFRKFIHTNFQLISCLKKTLAQLLLPVKTFSLRKRLEFNQSFSIDQCLAEVKELERIIGVVAHKYSKK